MRRLVVLSALSILVGLALLLSVVPIWSLLTTGSTSSGAASSARFISASSGGDDSTTTAEALVGFGLVGLGLILEIFSMFTEVGSSTPAPAEPETLGEKKP